MSEKKDLKVAPEAKALADEALEGVVGGVTQGAVIDEALEDVVGGEGIPGPAVSEFTKCSDDISYIKEDRIISTLKNQLKK